LSHIEQIRYGESGIIDTSESGQYHCGPQLRNRAPPRLLPRHGRGLFCQERYARMPPLRLFEFYYESPRVIAHASTECAQIMSVPDMPPQIVSSRNIHRQRPSLRYNTPPAAEGQSRYRLNRHRATYAASHQRTAMRSAMTLRAKIENS
jgi:hypothetical protein